MSQYKTLAVASLPSNDTTALIERIQRIESNVSSLNEWKTTVDNRLDNVEETNELIRSDQETMKIEFDKQLILVQEQYSRLSTQFNRRSIFQLAGIALISIIGLYYILNLWHLLFIK